MTRIHIAIMHDRRRAERLPRLLGWLGADIDDVRSGRDASISIGDGTGRGPWAAMRWCVLDFLDSGRPWCLLLEDDAEPTRSREIADSGAPLPPPTAGPSPSRGEGGGAAVGEGGGAAGGALWRIREACAEIAERIDRAGYGDAMAIHLCCTGGEAADLMDEAAEGERRTVHDSGVPMVPLEGAPVGTVAVLLGRTAAMHIRHIWQDWDTERRFCAVYRGSEDAGDARLWEMERGSGIVRERAIVRYITTRSLVEHGCASDQESLVRGDGAEWRVESGERRSEVKQIVRRMHRPVEGCPLEWVRGRRCGRGGNVESGERRA